MTGYHFTKFVMPEPDGPVHPLLSAIPTPLLRRGGSDTRALEQWCLDHQFRPSLLDIEQERARRRRALMA